jgi:hypothetical protein
MRNYVVSYEVDMDKTVIAHDVLHLSYLFQLSLSSYLSIASKCAACFVAASLGVSCGVQLVSVCYSWNLAGVCGPYPEHRGDDSAVFVEVCYTRVRGLAPTRVHLSLFTRR